VTSRSDILTNPRFAGEVERYHTWPTHRRQSVGEHTWQVFRIWFQIFGPLTPEESTYVLWHDAGELVLGDLPFPVKARNPGLKHVCDVIEAEALINMLGVDPLKGISTFQRKQKAKLCELIEMLEFGLSELAQGNRLAQPIIDDTREAITRLIAQLYDGNEKEVAARACAYIENIAQRY
jgi:hypothetical protein